MPVQVIQLLADVSLRKHAEDKVNLKQLRDENLRLPKKWLIDVDGRSIKARKEFENGISIISTTNG